MARIALVGAFCVVAVTVLSTGTEAMGPLEYGMEMMIRSHEGVCWYENLKNFPKTDAKGFNQCHGKQAFQVNNIKTNDHFKKYPDQKEKTLGTWTRKNVLKSLPEKYSEACDKYLDDSKAEPAADESDALNDQGVDYPYKAYSYCLMSTLRELRGDEAIEAVKNEKTHSKKNWMQAILDRENEFRALHGSEPLQLVKDLNTAAQDWADTMAKECKSYHSKNNDTGRQWRGSGTGESLFAGGGADEKDNAAYQAADGWYEEIKDYPFPEGYKDDDKELFMKIGHFTQSVWKSSKYVGYGYAYNKDCKPFTKYITARYSPPGNAKGKYSENVMPPKS